VDTPRNDRAHYQTADRGDSAYYFFVLKDLPEYAAEPEQYYIDSAGLKTFYWLTRRPFPFFSYPLSLMSTLSQKPMLPKRHVSRAGV